MAKDFVIDWIDKIAREQRYYKKVYEKLSKDFVRIKDEQFKLKNSVEQTYNNSKHIFLNNGIPGGTNWTFTDSSKTIKNNLPLGNLFSTVLTRANVVMAPRGLLKDVYLNNVNKLSTLTLRTTEFLALGDGSGVLNQIFTENARGSLVMSLLSAFIMYTSPIPTTRKTKALVYLENNKQAIDYERVTNPLTLENISNVPTTRETKALAYIEGDKIAIDYEKVMNPLTDTNLSNATNTTTKAFVKKDSDEKLFVTPSGGTPSTSGVKGLRLEGTVINIPNAIRNPTYTSTYGTYNLELTSAQILLYYSCWDGCRANDSSIPTIANDANLGSWLFANTHKFGFTLELFTVDVSVTKIFLRIELNDVNFHNNKIFWLKNQVNIAYDDTDEYGVLEPNLQQPFTLVLNNPELIIDDFKPPRYPQSNPNYRSVFPASFGVIITPYSIKLYK